MKKLSFYFDFLSPFSYFSWPKLRDEKNFEITFYPIPLGPILNHWGIKGPGEVGPKREFLLKQCLRYASKNHIDFTTPKLLPFNSLYALRISSLAASGENQKKVISALWDAGWKKRRDLGNPEEIILSLNENHLPGEEIFEKSFSREAKNEIKKNLEHALEKKVFGVPSFVIDDELFWGNDSLLDAYAYLNSEDLLDREKFIFLLAQTPKGASQTL